jgi:hypothetical protein
MKPLASSRGMSPTASTSTCTPFAALMCLSFHRIVPVEQNPCKELATWTVAPESIHQVDFEYCTYKDSLINIIMYSPFFAMRLLLCETATEYLDRIKGPFYGS